jgi:hypothetical protein
VKVEADVYALNGQRLLHRESVLDAAADDVTPVLPLELTQLEGDGTVLVHLAMRSQAGELLSENLYWRAASDAGYRKLNEMAAAQVEVSARGVGGRRIEVRLKNAGTVAALNVKLVTEQKDGGAEVLPAFYSDNYVSLLPGQERVVTVDLPRVEAKTPLEMKVYGWNVGESVVAVAP